MKPIRSLLAGLIFCLTGCCGPKIEDYAGKAPALDVRDYMDGDLEAWGSFFNRSGMDDRSFYVRMHGDFTDTEGTFKEAFVYNDGEKQQRVWHFRFIDDHHFTGTADDVIGTAQGMQYGNAVNMKYTLRVKVKSGKTYDLAMDDWLYLTDEKHMINRTHMSKFGFKVGELFIAFNKID